MYWIKREYSSGSTDFSHTFLFLSFVTINVSKHLIKSEESFTFKHDFNEKFSTLKKYKMVLTLPAWSKLTSNINFHSNTLQ